MTITRIEFFHRLACLLFSGNITYNNSNGTSEIFATILARFTRNEFNILRKNREIPNSYFRLQMGPIVAIVFFLRNFPAAKKEWIYTLGYI